MESKSPNPRKERANFTDLVCLFECMLIISENPFVSVSSMKEMKSSLKAVLEHVFRFFLTKHLSC